MEYQEPYQVLPFRLVGIRANQQHSHLNVVHSGAITMMICIPRHVCARIAFCHGGAPRIRPTHTPPTPSPFLTFWAEQEIGSAKAFFAFWPTTHLQTFFSFGGKEFVILIGKQGGGGGPKPPIRTPPVQHKPVGSGACHRNFIVEKSRKTNDK